MPALVEAYKDVTGPRIPQTKRRQLVSDEGEECSSVCSPLRVGNRELTWLGRYDDLLRREG